MGTTKKTILISFSFLTVIGLTVARDRSVTEPDVIPIPHMSLRSIIIPYVYDMDIYLTRGDGSQTQKFRKDEFKREFENSWGVQIKEYDGYLSAHVDRGQKLLVAVKALQEKRGWVIDLAKQHRLVSINLGSGEEVVLLADKSGERILCPQWAPDGTRIAFWKGKPQDAESGVFLLKLDTGNVRSLLKIKPFFSSCEDMGTYIRWIDNKRLVGHTRREGVWSVNTHNGSTKKVHEPNHIAGLPEDILAAMWGSIENPRMAPYWSADGSFYFYTVLKEGFWAKRWIERFEPRTGEHVPIKTIWWSPYRD